ncbi:Dynamin family [Thermoanaerobacter thermohydrosulfuricus WC1]|uniref:Dynamin family n=1 Tax=Thermoanaerobacter thermohydrosulfuricus WC1 TaxID=1198630 RepID=M8DNT8_THETY|nr:dynamin family protein [Thermoanaerobacter thermohydrosulfuricus]EMT38226.1 Dynamin family [Thermoanaerobacter thermohydrosulfuricus WC1]
MKKQYDQIKKSLDVIFEKIEKISKDINIKAVGEAVSEVKNKFCNNIFYLVILGQFKRGKSTFTNYMLGADVLPTGVVPLTSVITKIQYSTDIWAKVLYDDGRSENIDIKELDLYCTEKNNPKNIKGVKEIHIGYPFEFISNDVVIIDTPGIGSVYKHNTDVAYSYINKADAVIFLLSVDPPISELEKEFLSKISENVNRIFFVLNKIDYVNEMELKEIINFNENIVREITKNDNISIYPISAKLALEGKISKDNKAIARSGTQKLENDLQNFLIKEKEKVLLESYAKNIERIISMCQTFFESSIKLKQIPLERLESNIKSFENFIKEVEKSKKEISLLFQGDMKNILQNFDKKMEEYKQFISIRVSEKIKEYYHSIRDFSRINQKKELEKYLERAIIEEFEKLKGHIERDIEEQYSKALSNYLLRLNAVIDEVKTVANELFGINLEYFRSVGGITAESKFTYKIGYDVGALEIDPVYFTYFLPKKFAGKIILKRILDRVDIDVDRNIGRIRYDLLTRIEESFSEFEKDMNFKLQTMYDTVKELLAKSIKDYKFDRDSFEREKACYQTLLKDIEKIREELEHVLNMLK